MRALALVPCVFLHFNNLPRTTTDFLIAKCQIKNFLMTSGSIGCVSVAGSWFKKILFVQENLVKV